MLTFDNFKQIFERAGKPYWVLHKGTTKGTQIGSNTSLDETVGVEDGLAALEEIVSVYGDGVYTVECRTHPKANRGTDTHTFLIGDAQAAKPASVGSFQHPMAGFFQGLDARYFMEQISGAKTSENQLQIELLRKQFEVEDLRRQLKERQEGGIGERAIGLLEKNPGILDRLLGGAAPAIGTLGTSLTIPTAPISEEEEEEYGYEPGKLDFNALVESAMRIQKAIPGRHVNEVIDGLADWVEKNPKAAEQYLTMLQ